VKTLGTTRTSLATEAGGGGAGAIGGIGATKSVVSNLFISIPCEKNNGRKRSKNKMAK